MLRRVTTSQKSCPSDIIVLRQGINKNYKYQNNLRKDLKDKEHSEKLNDYIKKYNIPDTMIIKEMNNEEVDKFCEACDSFPTMINIPGFILHNVLEWK